MKTFAIPFKPIAWKRPVHWKGHCYDSQKKEKEKTAAYILSKDPYLFLPPIKVRLEFHMPMPKSWSQKEKEEKRGEWHTQKPDVDNLCKFIIDALNTVMWEDDSQIAGLSARKIWEYEGKTIIEVFTENENKLDF